MNRQKKACSKQGAIVGIFSALDPEGIQEVLLERSKQAALAFGVSLLEQDVMALCGERYSRKEVGQMYRGGSEETSIVLDGAKYRIQRPRVRNEEGEVELPTLSKLQDNDLLDEQMQQRLLHGVSTRKYDKVISSYSKKLGVSKSSVSRAFVRASQKDLDAINEGDLASYRFVGLMIDGIELAGRTVVAALGITDDLTKVPGKRSICGVIFRRRDWREYFCQDEEMERRTSREVRGALRDGGNLCCRGPLSWSELVNPSYGV